MDLASLAGVPPLEYEGIRPRYLPEVAFHGRAEHRSSQYALYASACIRGAVQPDLLNDAGWWNTPLWIYAVYAVVIYTRAAAGRSAMTVEQVVREIVSRHGLADEVIRACAQTFTAAHSCGTSVRRACQGRQAQTSAPPRSRVGSRACRRSVRR